MVAVTFHIFNKNKLTSVKMNSNLPFSLMGTSEGMEIEDTDISTDMEVKLENCCTKLNIVLTYIFIPFQIDEPYLKKKEMDKSEDEKMDLDEPTSTDKNDDCQMDIDNFVRLIFSYLTKDSFYTHYPFLNFWSNRKILKKYFIRVPETPKKKFIL